MLKQSRLFLYSLLFIIKKSYDVILENPHFPDYRKICNLSYKNKINFYLIRLFLFLNYFIMCLYVRIGVCNINIITKIL